MYQKIVKAGVGDLTMRIFGSYDANIQLVEKAFSVTVRNRMVDNGEVIVIEGEDADNVALATSVMEYLKKTALVTESITEQTVRYAIDLCSEGREQELADFGSDCICLTMGGKPIKAKTVGQKRYVEAIRKNTVVLGVGPAGTGKTFLAVAMAVKALRDKQVSRIILTRPAIEAGEKLGFLPGDLQSKIDPYLRPLYDALYEMMGAENYQHLLEKQTIEIAPLAYMRGRTLDDSFIILDEAQNATPEQMKMFLTRLGFQSRMVVTGDLTQTDLPNGQKSGLSDAVRILGGIEGIAIHTFTERDVVRHRLVQQIILAYDRDDKERHRRPAEKQTDKPEK